MNSHSVLMLDRLLSQFVKLSEDDENANEPIELETTLEGISKSIADSKIKQIAFEKVKQDGFYDVANVSGNNEISRSHSQSDIWKLKEKIKELYSTLHEQEKEVKDEMRKNEMRASTVNSRVLNESTEEQTATERSAELQKTCTFQANLLLPLLNVAEDVDMKKLKEFSSLCDAVLTNN